MHIEKAYFQIHEILERWSISEADLIYLAENDRLRLSVRVFGVLMAPQAHTTLSGAARHKGLSEPTRYNGLLDLYAQDVFQLFRCGEHRVRAFRSQNSDEIALAQEEDGILITIGDLLLTRCERDRFEISHGFASATSGTEDNVFIASADYADVRCNGHRYKLGPIQALAVQTLHQAARRDDRWQSGKAILRAAGSKSLRMSDVFKSQKNWRALILSDGRGAYRLNVE